MDQTETNEQVRYQPGEGNGETIAAAPDRRAAMVSPQTGNGGCGCGGTGSALNNSETTTPSYIFAIGRIEMRFPILAVEKEFAQATGRADTAGMTDRATFQAVLSERANRYIARQ